MQVKHKLGWMNSQTTLDTLQYGTHPPFVLVHTTQSCTFLHIAVMKFSLVQVTRTHWLFSDKKSICVGPPVPSQVGGLGESLATVFAPKGPFLGVGSQVILQVGSAQETTWT